MTIIGEEGAAGDEHRPEIDADAVLVAEELVDDRWRLRQCLASGAGGAVWLAHDERLRRDVALRFVASHLVIDDEARRLAVHEATLLARVEHQNVICLFDVLELPSGMIFVSEYVDGLTLGEVAERTAPCAEPFVAAVGLQVARGLRAVHERNVIHHDLRHKNVRLLDNGTVKIINFGSATGFTSAERTTTAVAPPACLAPEQFAPGPVDHRADVYALGLMLWELAAGTTPFPEYSASASVETRLYAEPAPLHTLECDVSEALSAAVQRATRRWPEDRWQHAADLESALTRICGPRPEYAVREHLEHTGFV